MSTPAARHLRSRIGAAIRASIVFAVVALPAHAVLAQPPAAMSDVASPSPSMADTSAAIPLGSLTECVDACDVMSGLEQCLIDCRAHWLRCSHCCLTKTPSATAAHCKAVCSDDLDAYVCGTR